MDTTAMLGELRSELDAINETILVLERLVRDQGKRRGRPPKWMAENLAARDNKQAAAKRKKKRR
jgi:hypothetical protein